MFIINNITYTETLIKDSKGRIDWKRSVGISTKFLFNSVEHDVLIVSENQRYIDILIDNSIEYHIKKNTFLKCGFKNVLNNTRYTHMYEVDSVLDLKFSSLKILECIKEYVANKDGKKYSTRAYKTECLKCGDISIKFENNLKSGHGCGVCANKIAKLNINTIYDTDNWMLEFIDEDVSKSILINSNKKIEFKCPICGYVRESYPYNIKNRGFNCPICSHKGMSYPEKFMYSLFKNLNVSFKHQVSNKDFSWIGRYRYDFYLDDYKTFIEVDGFQHNIAKKSFFKLKEGEQSDRDLIKDNLVSYNGFKLIRVEAYESMFEYIKNSVIENKELNNILNLDNLNWDFVAKGIKNNLIEEVCKFKMENLNMTNKDIGKAFNIYYATVSKYFKLGLSHYSWFKYEIPDRYKINSPRLKNKKVLVMLNNEVVCNYKTSSEVKDYIMENFNIQLSLGSIRIASAGKNKLGHKYKNFEFYYI